MRTLAASVRFVGVDGSVAPIHSTYIEVRNWCVHVRNFFQGRARSVFIIVSTAKSMSIAIAARCCLAPASQSHSTLRVSRAGTAGTYSRDGGAQRIRRARDTEGLLAPFRQSRPLPPQRRRSFRVIQVDPFDAEYHRDNHVLKRPLTCCRINGQKRRSFQNNR